MNSISKFN